MNNNTQNHTGKANDMVYIEELEQSAEKEFLADENWEAVPKVWKEWILDTSRKHIEKTYKQAVKDTEESVREELSLMLETLRHTHVAGTTVGKDIDECAKCGLDLRHQVHSL